MNADKVIDFITPPWSFEDYAHVIRPMPKEYGEGFVITFPDLPDCMSDGKTQAEAIENGRDAFLCYVSTLADVGEELLAAEKQCFLPVQGSARHAANADSICGCRNGL